MYHNILFCQCSLYLSQNAYNGIKQVRDGVKANEAVFNDGLDLDAYTFSVGDRSIELKKPIGRQQCDAETQRARLNATKVEICETLISQWERLFNDTGLVKEFSTFDLRCAKNSIYIPKKLSASHSTGYVS